MKFVVSGVASGVFGLFLGYLMSAIGFTTENWQTWAIGIPILVVVVVLVTNYYDTPPRK